MRDLGPWTNAQLRAQGISDSALADLVARGQLRRVRRGWFAGPFSPEAANRAIRLGGRLGCLSACQVHGLWVPQQGDLHVMLNPGSKVVARAGSGVIYHPLTETCSTAVATLIDSLTQVLHRHDAETALVVLESAVNSGKLHEADARRILSAAPARKLHFGRYFSPLAQSGSETRLRLFFQRRGVAVEPQAVVPGVGRVDLLVGKSWIIEADSKEHHSAPRNVAVDCERDFNARQLGYVRDRLSYEQSWLTWSQTQQWLAAILQTRRHLAAPSPLRHLGRSA